MNMMSTDKQHFMITRKKLSIITYCFILFVINAIKCEAQSVQTDTVKLMTYNVGNFGRTPTSQCPLYDFNLKSGYLRTILKYESPDIIGLIKIDSNQMFCNNTIVNYVLDSICDGCWGYGTFSQVSTYSKKNMLYFNTNKFGFAGSTVIYSNDPNISDITVHKLFYKTQNLSITHDTTFLKIVLAHLNSGSSNTADRGTEVAGAMSWLNAHIVNNENLIFMGDFNTTSSTESCFHHLINSSNNNTKFYDPPNQLGQWSASPANFALYLTESTRTGDPGDCNAVGGLNNRFDHILITSAIKNGTNSIKYIHGSYKVIGQDGNHTGNALIDQPINTSVPGSVDSALYYMSEHLPVIIKMTVSYPINTGLENYSNQQINIDYNSIVTNNIIIQPITYKIFESNFNNCKVVIFDMLGRIIFSTSIDPKQTNVIDISNFPSGMYFFEIKIDKRMTVKKFIKQ